MSKVSKRYYDLIVRKSTLETMIDKMEEELKNNVMIMLAKSMDENLEYKLAGSLAATKEWLTEIESEIKTIEGKLQEEIENEWKNKVFREMDKENNKDKE